MKWRNRRKKNANVHTATYFILILLSFLLNLLTFYCCLSQREILFSLSFFIITRIHTQLNQNVWEIYVNWCCDFNFFFFYLFLSSYFPYFVYFIFPSAYICHCCHFNGSKTWLFLCLLSKYFCREEKKRNKMKIFAIDEYNSYAGSGWRCRLFSEWLNILSFIFFCICAKERKRKRGINDYTYSRTYVHRFSFLLLSFYIDINVISTFVWCSGTKSISPYLFPINVSL